MEIGLDFDGVITDCGQLKSEGAKKLYGIDIPAGRFKKELIVGGNILTLKEYRNLQKIVYETKEVGLSMKPVNGVLQYLPKLIEAGHRVIIITSRDCMGLQVAEEWSLERGLELEFIGVGYGNNKVAAATGLDVYVDDDFDKLEQLVGIVSYLYLFSWEYNQHIKNIDPVIRIASWEKLFAHIQLI